jgi:hypothetical protein
MYGSHSLFEGLFPMTTTAPAAQALKQALGWIKLVPTDAPLPAMPGFDWDWAASLADGTYYDDEPGARDIPVETATALSYAQEWIAAVPEDIKAQLPAL